MVGSRCRAWDKALVLTVIIPRVSLATVMPIPGFLRRLCCWELEGLGS